MMKKDQKNRIIFLLILGAITAWFCYLIARPFITPVFFAGIFAIVFFPLHTRVQTLIKNENLSALVSTLFVLLVIIVPAAILGIEIRKELIEAYNSLNAQSAQEGGIFPYLLHLSERITNWTGRYIDISNYNVRGELVQRLQQTSSFLLSQLYGVVGNLLTFIVYGLISFFTLFFIFRDGRAGYRRLSAITPLRPAQVEKLASEVGKAINASMFGGLAVAAAQGLLTGLAFWALGISSPIFWGMAAAIFSFVPIIGTTIIWLPAAIFLIISGSWIKGLILIGFGGGVIGLADNFIRPYIISGQVNFHPLHIFFALLGGVQAFGILGLFVGPVVLAIAQALFGLIREEFGEMKVED